MGVVNGTLLKLPNSSVVATTSDEIPVPLNVIVAPPIGGPATHSNVPDNVAYVFPTVTSTPDNINDVASSGHGFGEEVVVLVGSLLITFEELKSHEVPAVQFWFDMILLPLFEIFELAEALPITNVLSNIVTSDANPKAVDVLPMLWFSPHEILRKQYI